MASIAGKEASELVHLLLDTPIDQRASTWPSLLALLARWARTGLREPSSAAAPARPWERNRPQQQQQQHQREQRQQQLLRQAITAIHDALQGAAMAVDTNSSQSASQAANELASLLPSALAFLAAAAHATTKGPADAPQVRRLAAAAACAAVTALSATPHVLPWLSEPSTPDGLAAVLAGCQGLLVACVDDPASSSWLFSCVLAAMHTAAAQLLREPLPLQQQQHAAPGCHQVQLPSTSTISCSSSSVAAWVEQQAADCAAAGCVGPLMGLYVLGQELAVSHCRTAAASAASAASAQLGHLPGPQAAAVETLGALTNLLSAACQGGGDPLLLGLAATAAAGLCAGLGLGQGLLAVAVAPGPPGPSGDSFDALADAAWQGAASGPAGQQPPASSSSTSSSSRRQQHPHHVRQHRHAGGAAASVQHQGHTQADAALAVEMQQQQQVAALHQQLLQQSQQLLDAVAVACGRCWEMVNTSAAASQSAADLVGQRLLGYAYSKLMSQQQQQQQISWCGLRLALHYALQQPCSMAGVFYYAAGAGDAAAANTWLLRHQAQHPAQDVGVLARWLAAAAQQLPPQRLLQLLLALRADGARLASSYSLYQQALPAAVAAQLDAAAVRQQLDKTFALHTMLLADVWQACNSRHYQQQQQQQERISELPDATAGSAASAAAAAATPSGAGGSSGARGQAAGVQPADARAGIVAASLADLASLQFCRVQLPAYVDLLMALVTDLATSSSTADAFVSAALPCYDRLIGPAPSSAWGLSSSSSSGGGGGGGGGGGSGAVWLRDQVAAAELSFLLPLIPVAVRGAPQPAAAAERAVPLLLLLLPHPVPALAQAAHAAFAGLLAVAADDQQPQQQPQEQQPQEQQPLPLMQVLQQAVPMYLNRSLSGLPSYGSLEGFNAGFYSLLKHLPTRDVMTVLTVRRVAERALELAAAAAPLTPPPAAGEAHVQEPAPHGPAPSMRAGLQGQQQQQPAGGDVSSRLFELLVLGVQLADYQALPSVLREVAACVLAAPPGAVQQRWLGLLYGGCLAVADYTRKTGLMHWFDGVAKQQQQQQQQGRRPHPQLHATESAAGEL